MGVLACTEIGLSEVASSAAAAARPGTVRVRMFIITPSVLSRRGTAPYRQGFNYSIVDKYALAAGPRTSPWRARPEGRRPRPLG
ncbi:hypothetical protein GCM10012278_35060 [Nonomuraea glycinis]|uniref:Uncharacterized protein n=1 Tax=Nonomuraea glycinis TaxID=2047744 RepID=A0A918A4U2_9ACTN|nr:hypothetical protein GCM10012278_35060 [Nonomuraea glycinis]